MKKTTEQFITSDGMVMYLQCFVPFHYKERNTAAALIVPGGQCAPEDYNWISSTLCRRGYLVYSIYQRGYGSGAPRVNDHAGERQLQDLKEAFEFVKGQPLVDQDRIVVIGHSYGADMVQRLALEKEFACGVVLSQLSDWLTYAKYAKEFQRVLRPQAPHNSSALRHRDALYRIPCHPLSEPHSVQNEPARA